MPERVSDRVEGIETTLLLGGLHELYGVDFRGYDPGFLKSRLHVFMQARGCRNISDLQAKVLHRPEVARDLMRHLSDVAIPLLDHRAHVLALRHAVLPLLRSCPHSNIWIAECARATSVMTLAMLLEEEGLYDRAHLFATNANPDLLAEVSALKYDLVGAGVDADAMRRNMTMAQFDLVGDASFNEFQLIVCERPLHDLGMPLQHRVMRLFSESLCPFGILQITPCSDLARSSFSVNYKAISREHGIYQRIA